VKLRPHALSHLKNVEQLSDGDDELADLVRVYGWFARSFEGILREGYERGPFDVAVK
jgi:hypothetical protein